MKRSYNILVLTMLLLAFCKGNNCTAQTPSWAWARNAVKFGGSAGVKGMGNDAAGNTYTMGYTYGDIQFGILPRLHGSMFLVKHDPQGKPVWSFDADCMPSGFATDSVGNSYVTGFFQNTLQLGSKTLICQGKKDIFVAKFDSAGNLVWANRAGGIGNPGAPPMPPIKEDEGYSLGVDAAGNCYVGGMVIASNSAAAIFDTIAVFPPVPSLFPTHFNVLAKYNASGQIQWVKTINSSHWLTRVMAVSKQGQCFMSGIFGDTLDYSGTTLTSNGQVDICLASFESNGNLTWVKSYGGSGADYGDALAVDKRGNVFLTGAFSDTAHFGSTILIKPASSLGTSTLFIAKLNSAGNVLWANQATGTGSAGDSKMALDAAGNSYICSAFRNGVVIGSQTFSSVNAMEDVLVSKWDTTGTPVWAVVAQGGGIDMPGGIALDPVSKSCYVAGNFEYNLNFGNTILQTGPTTTFFLAKLSSTVSCVPKQTGKEANLIVFPNPATSSFTVKLSKTAGLKGKFILYNITGQLVREVSFSNGAGFVVDRENLPAGLYMYKLESGNKGTKAGKIVLQ